MSFQPPAGPLRPGAGNKAEAEQERLVREAGRGPASRPEGRDPRPESPLRRAARRLRAALGRG